MSDIKTKSEKFSKEFHSFCKDRGVQSALVTLDVGEGSLITSYNASMRDKVKLCCASMLALCREEKELVLIFKAFLSNDELMGL